MAGLNGVAASGVTYDTTTPILGTGSYLSPAAGSYITVPAGTTTLASTWTWECRFRSSTKPAALQVMMGCGSGSNTLGYIGVNTSGFAVYNITAGNTTITGTVNICDGNAHVLRLVANGSSGIIAFLDGAIVGTSTAVAVGAGTNVGAFIGNFTAASLTYALKVGDLDEVAFWLTAVSTAAYTPLTTPYVGNEGMVALYHLDGNALDSSTATLTVNTPATTTTSASMPLSGTYVGSAPTGINYYFDSTASYVAATGFTASAGTWAATGVAPTTAGSHTVTVEELNYTSATATSGTFTVSASSTPTITVATPASTTVGTSISLSGIYTLTAPTGINYYYDATGTYVAATGFAVNTTALTWTASTAADAPAAGSHTITVQEANSTGTTATSGSFTTTASSLLIAPNNAAFLYSPGNWTTPTSVQASTINAGAYIKIMFTGATCILNFNVTNNLTPLSEIYYRIDGYEAQSPFIEASVANTITVAMPSNTSTFPYHLLEIYVKSTTETQNRWNSPYNTAVVFTGLTLAVGASVLAPVAKTGIAYFYGDSITEGVRTVGQAETNDTDRNDCLNSWSHMLGEALGMEYGIIGFGGSGLTVVGSGNVPILSTSYNQIMNGVSRTFSPTPNVIIINEGTNDQSASAATFQAAMQVVLNDLLAATPSTTKIIVMRTFGGYQAAATQAAITAVSSSRITYVDTTGFLNATYGVDSTGYHPTGANDMGQIGPKLINAILPLLQTGGAARSYVCS